MKGVKYNLIFTLPNNDKILHNELFMNDLVETIEKEFEKNYFIKPKLSNYLVYNIMKRPHKASKMLTERIKICRC